MCLLQHLVVEWHKYKNISLSQCQVKKYYVPEPHSL
jgi:hypothetical protein